MCFDRRERLGHSVHERLDANEAGVRQSDSFPNQMFAAAKPNFQAHIVNGRGKQVAKIRGRRLCQIEREMWKQRVEEIRLSRTQGLALAAAKERALCVASVAAGGVIVRFP
jgi:hypothetical protein